MFTLIDFEDTFVENRNESFNEGFLGIGLVGGITDYGRYLALTPAQFHKEVEDNFLNGYHQYIHFVKEGKLPAAIKIKKHKSGWVLKPVF